MAVTHRLIAFSDDWGRHPSSCQHLMRHLTAKYPVLWVNTIGMRTPSLSKEDLGKAAGKLVSWLGFRDSRTKLSQQKTLPPNMRVIDPRMWPGFGSGWQRRLNARWLSQAVHAALGPRRDGEQRTVITTLPITADLIGRLDVDRWVYYCVDDFSVWPGLDGPVIREMEEKLVRDVDRIVAVSNTLQQRLSDMGRPSALLTHGIELDHWSSHSPETAQSDAQPGQSVTDASPDFFRGVKGPILLFWGLIDARLDMAWCRAISQASPGTLVMVGPEQSPDPALRGMAGVKMYGPAAYSELPALARQADVLVMPYADLPVTRAMQPLKFKEYLATGQPVVARGLPGISEWADAADLVNDEADLLEKIRLRLDQGISMDQKKARERLNQETWAHKARTFESLIFEKM
jgi:hypothetical protein